MSAQTNDEIVEIICSSNKNLLILDTCCILDIVRTIPRSDLAVLEAALKIISENQAKTNKYIMVLPSLVSSEYCDNIETVVDETKKYIHKQDECHRLLVNHYNAIFSANLSYTEFSRHDLAKKLRFISKDILGACLILNENSECQQKALSRVIAAIPPSAKGKDSTKDCIIFEDVLWLCRTLRTHGFTNKIIFVSSNTKEYDNKRIIGELHTYSACIAYSLNHSYHLAISL